MERSTEREESLSKVKGPIISMNFQPVIPMNVQAAVAIILSWVVQVFYASYSQETKADSIRSFCVLCFASGAAFFLGTITGIVFGLPRLRTSELNAPSSARGPVGVEESLQRARLRDNTNLEDISDWLTKIIIGIGIAQFNKILTMFWLIAHRVAVGMGPPERIDGSEVFAASCILYNLICGFLFYYFWARMQFYRDLQERDR